MRMLRGLRPGLVMVFLGVGPLLGAELNPAAAAVFPFVLPWDDASPGLTDCAGWNRKPAGRDGFLRIGPDGHFYAGDRRIRFLGVNFSFGAGMPDQPDARKIAARLAKFGINVVRFHHLDTGTYPNGICSATAKGSGALHPEALDRLSYFVAQLKQHGIYANLNLLVGRPFNAADGLPAAIESLEKKDRHLIGFFDARQLALQQDYARRLLTHRNPYTGLTFAADPAVAFVEINNEQGLIHGWLGNKLDRLPREFLAELHRQWNDWLSARYGSTAAVRRAWQEAAQPLGAELLRNPDLAEDLTAWNLERHGGAVARTTLVSARLPALRSARNEANAVQVEVERPGAASWHVQLNQAGLALQGGQAYTVQFWAKSDQARLLHVSVSMAHEPWGQLGLSDEASLGTVWRRFRFVFLASQSDAEARLNFADFGSAGATTWLAGISLKPGGVVGLKAGESIEAGSVARLEKASFGERTPAAQRDWLRFLQATEGRYWQAMERFLKENLRVRALVGGTIVGCSTPNLMAQMDWVDTHAYWQHPRFPGRPWDPANWVVENRSMVNERGGTLPRLALKRVAGKPHACTEYNHPAPNTYSSEAFLLLAAYAALQDWDAIYVYSYAHSRAEGWDTRKINGFFDIDQHPTKMATLPAVAALFRRGDVQPARQLWLAALSAEQEADLLRRARSWSLVDGSQLGIPPEAALVHRVGLVTGAAAVPAATQAINGFNDRTNRFVSDTGELTWDLREPGRGVVLVNTPKSKAVIGFGGGRIFQLGEVKIELGQGLQNGWGAVTLTAMGAASEPPRRWLVTATGYADNTGMGWKNPEKSTVGRDWGRAPSRVEGVRARITWPASVARLTAWALDERGQRKHRLPIETRAGQGTGVRLDPKWRTLWYEVQVE